MKPRTASARLHHFVCRRYLVIAAVLFLALFIHPITANRGRFTYQMDDTYIHMAMARNLAEHGAWSINPEGFISASSSLLYTVLLAALFRVSGPGLYMMVPLVLNLVLAALCLLVADRMLREAGRAPILRFLVLLLAVLALPLPGITFMSMEHVLHLLLSLLAVRSLVRVVSGGGGKDARDLLLLLPLLTTVRFEGLFFLPPVLVLLAARRRFRLALAALTVSVVPLVAFGAYSVSRGSFPLPNPIVIKGVVKAKETLLGDPQARPAAPAPDAGKGRIVSAVRKVAWRFVSKSYVLGLLVLTTIFFWIRVRSRKGLLHTAPIHYFVFVPVLVTHVLLAGIGRQYRYEVYLMGMGILLVGLGFPRLRELKDLARTGRVAWLWGALAVSIVPLFFGMRSSHASESFTAGDHAVPAILLGASAAAYLLRKRGSGALLGAHAAVAAAMLLLLVPVTARGLKKQLEVPEAMRNIHEQQVQMGRFIHTHYRGRTVAVNDIGAVSYFGGATILDLWGLGDDEVLLARLRGEYDTEFIEALLRRRDVAIVVVYDRWFERFGGLPGNLRPAGSWEVEKSVVLGGKRVTFHALDEEGLGALGENLRRFEPSLPTGVAVSYAP